MMDDPMSNLIIRIQGLLELSVIIFLIGVLLGIPFLVILGGILMVIDDLLGMFTGALNPVFPILLAVILAFTIKPWYVGVFWSLAAFGILDIPTALKKIIKGSKAIPAK